MNGTHKMATRKEFARRLRHLMHKRGITQRRLAQKIGVTEAAMSFYACGKRVPKPEILKEMVEELHTSADYLIGLKNE